MVNSKKQHTQYAGPTRLLRKHVSLYLAHHSYFEESQRPSWDTVPGGACFVKPQLMAHMCGGLTALMLSSRSQSDIYQQMALSPCCADYA